MPESGFADAVAVFGVTGIGTSELLFYAYWCLEKSIQTLTLPVFAIAVLIIRRMRTDEFRPGRWYDYVLYLSVTVISCAALYSVWRLIAAK
jgi:hypothetical protein